jgi:hypothetical protein
MQPLYRLNLDFLPAPELYHMLTTGYLPENVSAANLATAIREARARRSTLAPKPSPWPCSTSPRTAARPEIGHMASL